MSGLAHDLWYALLAGVLCIADVLESAMTPAAVVIAAIACAAVAIFTA